MGKIQDVEKIITSLSAEEKAQLIQRLSHELGQSFPGIESTTGVCGGEPCIVRTRIPVWALEQSRRLGMSDAEILKNYPTLRAEDLGNAWAYVLAHPKEIDEQIRLNETA